MERDFRLEIVDRYKREYEDRIREIVNRRCSYELYGAHMQEDNTWLLIQRCMLDIRHIRKCLAVMGETTHGRSRISTASDA